MTRAVFVANAVMALSALALCVWHAAPDRDRLAFLGAGVVYGVILEQLVILHFEAYHYNAGDYLLTVGDVPVVIGLGWAAIVYSGVEIGSRLSVSRRTLPAFVALFALHVDLAIDAIAIRIPFWTWTPPGAWLGVPLGNFLGWYLVASTFTAAWLALRTRLDRPLLAAALSIPVAVAGLAAVLEVWTTFVTTLPLKVAVLTPIIVLSAWAVVHDGITLRPLDARVAAVPLLYHGFYLGAMIALGLYRDQPLVAVVGMVMLVVGVALHAGRLARFRGLTIGG